MITVSPLRILRYARIITIGGLVSSSSFLAHGMLIVLLSETPAFASSYYDINHPDLLLWLKTDSLTNYLPGESVTSWPSVDNELSAAVYSGSTGPSLTTNAVNGWDAVYFDGSNDFLDIVGFFDDNGLATNGFSVFMVTKSDDPYFGVSGNQASGGGGAPRLYLTRQYFTCNELTDRITSSTSSGEIQVHCAEYDGDGTMALYVDGELIDQKEIGTFSDFGSTGSLAIPFQSGGNHSGYLAELIILKGIPDDFTFDEITAYLNAKYISSASPCSFSQYTANVDGDEVFVYPVRVSKNCYSAQDVETKQVLQQRPLSDTEVSGFISFQTTNGPVEVEITVSDPIEQALIYPVSCNVSVVTNSSTNLTFTLPWPGHYVLDVYTNRQHALHIFANPIPDNINVQDPNVVYFGPGMHYCDTIVLTNNQTLYLDEGCVLFSRVESTEATNITICGSGILDGSLWPGWFEPKNSGWPSIALMGCQNVVIKDIIIRDSPNWTVAPVKCDNVLVDNLKMINWRWHSDGIDLLNCRYVNIRNSFFRTFDDCVTIKGYNMRNHYSTVCRASYGITVEDCVFYNDWGKPFVIGTRLEANAVRNVVFQNSEVIRWASSGIGITAGLAVPDVTVISNVVVQNIFFDECWGPRYNYSGTNLNEITLQQVVSNGTLFAIYRDLDFSPPVQKVTDVTLNNITADVQPVVPLDPSILRGHSNATYTTENITFNDVYIEGSLLNTTNQLSVRYPDSLRNINFNLRQVGGSGNAADDTGYGTVNYTYCIGTYEVTTAQWNAYLGVGGGDDTPQTFVSWYDAARYCNWLTSGNTNAGVYQFDGNGDLLAIDRSGAQATYTTVYALPTEDEWYKAAYYDPNNQCYYDLPTGSDSNPAAEAPPGSVNSANYDNAVGDTTDVGSYAGSGSPYGTFDQGGNVFEWIESTNVVVRGGAYDRIVSHMKSANRQTAGSLSDAPGNRGFRIVVIP